MFKALLRDSCTDEMDNYHNRTNMRPHEGYFAMDYLIGNFLEFRNAELASVVDMLGLASVLV